MPLGFLFDVGNTAQGSVPQGRVMRVRRKHCAVEAKDVAAVAQCRGLEGFQLQCSMVGRDEAPCLDCTALATIARFSHYVA